MSDNDASGILSELDGARAELEAWRSDPAKSKRIPASVWEKAVRACSEHGLHTVSRVLVLSYSDLKGHVNGLPGRRHCKAGAAVAFVEVTPVPSAEDSSCIIELSKASGTRMRICVKSSEVVDWCRIKEAFLGA